MGFHSTKIISPKVLIPFFRKIINEKRINKSILSHWKSIDIQPKDRLVFFAHFDEKNEIKPYVIYYLQRIFELDCNIVFISTVEKLPAIEIEKIKPFCISIISKKNIGLDFGSWKTGMHLLNKSLPNYKSIIFANDSCFAPAFDLEPIIEDFKNNLNQISGITFSHESHRKPHLQSYFLWINNTSNNIKFISDFFSKVKFLKNKRKIIKKYEVGFTQKAISKSIKINQWVNNAEFENDYNLKNQNHTIENAALLLLKRKSPFIKCAIFKDANYKEAQNSILNYLNNNNLELYNIIAKQYPNQN